MVRIAGILMTLMNERKVYDKLIAPKEPRRSAKSHNDFETRIHDTSREGDILNLLCSFGTRATRSVWSIS